MFKKYFILFLYYSTTIYTLNAYINNNKLGSEWVNLTRVRLTHAMDWAQSTMMLNGSDRNVSKGMALGDCFRLYRDSELRLSRLVSGEMYGVDDAVTWLTAAAVSHRSCVDGLEEKGLVFEEKEVYNLSSVIEKALGYYGSLTNNITSGRAKIVGDMKVTPKMDENGGLLATWNSRKDSARFVVAQDGSSNFKTINEALAWISQAKIAQNRIVVYVKSGVYNEKVEIKRNLRNLMFVGDGIDKTIITGNRNVPDGSTTGGSATFSVFADGFWARDITFENTAGPRKHQAVALNVASDLSVFYRCSFKGYQDTLLVHSLRQFYRDCHIYGTIDFIFGDASAVFQNCDIFVRRPLDHQSNMITAQGRNNKDENSGISIINSRVAAAPDFEPVKGRFRTYLGRPWKRYSRTVILKTDLDALIDPKGWTEWTGNFALSTLYYGEYMNSGRGASTTNRVNWPGFHVLHDPKDAYRFAPSNFIQGDSWIPATGVPYSSGI